MYDDNNINNNINTPGQSYNATCLWPDCYTG